MASAVCQYLFCHMEPKAAAIVGQNRRGVKASRKRGSHVRRTHFTSKPVLQCQQPSDVPGFSHGGSQAIEEAHTIAIIATERLALIAPCRNLVERTGAAVRRCEALCNVKFSKVSARRRCSSTETASERAYARWRMADRCALDLRPWTLDCLRRNEVRVRVHATPV